MDINFRHDGDEHVAIYSKYKYSDFWQKSVVADGIVRKFPFILRGDGTPWEIGNEYIMVRFQEECTHKRPRISTYTRKAEQLLQFLRWIEHNQAEGKPVNEFTFPEQKHNRVTYAYHRYIKRRMKLEGWSVASAKFRLSVVVNFYRWIIRNYPEKIENEPFQEWSERINQNGAFGGYGINVRVTDLSIKKSGAKAKPSEKGEILDGGERLTPLGLKEQEIFQHYLALYGNYTFQLMCWFALYTGARIQTIATMRISVLRKAYSIGAKTPKGDYRIRVGVGTDVDCKYSNSDMMKSYDIAMPENLVELLLEYADSDFARACRLADKSFYGDTDENYLFLSEVGTPYITSEKEIIDRESPEYSKRISRRDRVNFVINEGQSVWQWINRLWKLIKQDHPDFRKFRFHDLRATFAFNDVCAGLDAGLDDSEIAQSLADKMGHASPSTSMAYVRFDRMTDKIATHQEFHSNKLRADIKKYKLGNFKDLEDTI
jgi:integrase